MKDIIYKHSFSIYINKKKTDSVFYTIFNVVSELEKEISR